MADLLEVLPDFDVKPYSHLLFSLKKKDITVADLISLNPLDIAKSCPLPPRDVENLVKDVIAALQKDVITSVTEHSAHAGRSQRSENPDGSSNDGEETTMVRTLDPSIDQLLGGGFMPGHITEIVGESAVGKTQFVLGLLLSAQLPPPRGLGKAVIYISTESPLSTGRLYQILASHPVYQDLPIKDRPTLDRVRVIDSHCLEVQHRIIQHQLLHAVERYNVGLVVMDSVAANFRAEHETSSASGLADRATDLVRLGSMLRRVAIEAGAAVVVTNQVADRFDESSRIMQDRLRSSSPASSSSQALPKPNRSAAVAACPNDVLTLDHQQRFFTGWGDQPDARREELKTPTLGLAWANQISARIVLKLEAEKDERYSGGNIWRARKRRRFVAVVFSPWAEPSPSPVEYEIKEHGISSFEETPPSEDPATNPHAELLDESLWDDEDEEFP